MPRVNGIMQVLPGSYGVPNRPIESAKYNTQLDDIVADLNAARPITAGGTGATSAAAAREALDVPRKADVPTKTEAVLLTGSTSTGKQGFAAGTAARASINVPPGVVPDAPVSGDIWGTTVGGLFYRVGTVTRSLIDDTGGVFKGPVELPAGVAAAAPLAIPPGVAPTSPVNGDLWGTSVGLYYRRASVTRRLLDDTANGVTNTLLASMAANTVKAQLGSAGGPSDVTMAALLTAFGTFINGSANGYVRIPLTDSNGAIVNFILQWGRTTASGGDVSITYPIAFPTTALFAIATLDLQGNVAPATDAHVAAVRSVTRTSFIVNRRAISGASGAQVQAASEPADWLAIGY